MLIEMTRVIACCALRVGGGVLGELFGDVGGGFFFGGVDRHCCVALDSCGCRVVMDGIVKKGGGVCVKWLDRMERKGKRDKVG